MSICRSQWNYFNDCRWLRASGSLWRADVQVGRQGQRCIYRILFHMPSDLGQHINGWMEVKKQNGDEDLLSTVEFECLSSYQNQDLRYFLLAYRLSLLREQSWHYVSQHVISTRLEYNLLRRAFQFFLFIQHCWLCWCAGILCTYCFYGGHSTYRMGHL